ncbi:MAG: hypothetical protein JWR48_3754 [Mycobacterium sp.]|nr:hypothetical protein [Mycobacterium sp.]
MGAFLGRLRRLQLGPPLSEDGHYLVFAFLDYLVFAFLDQEGGEIEYPYIPVAGRQRIAGRHSHVVFASQQGRSIILAAARQPFDPRPRFYNAELQRLRPLAQVLCLWFWSFLPIN